MRSWSEAVASLRRMRRRGPTGVASAVWNSVRGDLHRHVLRRDVIEKRIYNYRMLLNLEDRGISRNLLLFGKRELDHKIILEQVLRPGMNVLDIGANIGYYVLMELGLVGCLGRVVAVEPSAANLALLKRNLELNAVADRVTVIEGAVSDRSGCRRFFLSRESNLNTFHAGGGAMRHLSGETIEVTTYTVPDIVEIHGYPNLIRMDIEGHEVEVINGMLPAIRDGLMAPMIIFEAHRPQYSQDHNLEAPLRKLFEHGYGVRLLSSSSESGTQIIESRGYRGSAPIATDSWRRVIYPEIAPDDSVDLICRTDAVRTVLLSRPATGDNLCTETSVDYCFEK